MKTSEMSSTLVAFAALASSDRAEELRKFAGIFRSGKEETVAARIKRISKGLAAHAGRWSYPRGLKESLVIIAAGFTAAKARQASDFVALEALFDGGTGVSVDEFVTRLHEAVIAAEARPTRRAAQAQPPDQHLADTLATELERTLLEPNEFAKVMDRLRDAASVPTPTLGAVANRFLGNEKRYKGRKAALDDIAKRQRDDAHTHARGKALDRLGV
jgi:hypothetical protein